MRLNARKPSGREKDEASVKLLAQLREELHSGDVTIARKAACKLSWMQEDGLDILKEALFGHTRRYTKGAAAYGLRRMHGRMKKKGLEVIANGIKSTDNNIVVVCEKALSLLRKGVREKSNAKRLQKPRIQIKEIPPKRKPQRKSTPKKTPGQNLAANQNFH